MIRRIFFSIIAFLIAEQAFAKQINCPINLTSLSNARIEMREEIEKSKKRVKKKLNGIPEIDQSIDDEGYTEYNLYLPGRKIDLDNWIGSIVFTVSKNGKKLKIIDINVDHKFRRKGLASFMYAMVFTMHPQIERVETENMGKTNGEELRTALLDLYPELEAVLLERPHDVNARALERAMKKVDCQPALERTPAYLIRAAFGFSKIVEVDCSKALQDIMYGTTILAPLVTVRP